MQSKINVDLENLTIRLIRIASVAYIVFGLFELINYFYRRPINLFQLLFYVSMGVGLFERHSWSRTLCIISSGITISLAIVMFIFGGEVLWNGISVSWGMWYVIAIIIVHSFPLYILLRNDVKNLFSEKEK